MSKKTKMTLCRNCNTPISKKAKICPSCGAKNKKPFFKRVWFVLFVILFLMYGVSTIKRMQKEKFVWDELELAERLPKPETNIGIVHNDSKDYLNLEVKKISEKQYKDYILECQKLKYTIEEKKEDGRYHAFQEDGYELSLRYYDYSEELNIELRAPMQMEVLSWPKSEIAGLLPTPESSVGKVSKDTSDECLIYVGEISMEAFDSYVDQCAEKGFTIDYERGDEFYKATDEAGNRISVKYQGNRVMSIELHKPEEKETEPIVAESEMSETESIDAESEMTEKETLVETETDETEENMADEVPSNDIRPEFKEAMDSYETFISEYCDFMKKYAETDGTDLGLLADYAKYMSKYADMAAGFEAWESDEMNAAELAYYMEVQTRISKKLVEAAIE